MAKRTYSIDWGGGQFWDKDSVFRAEHFNSLPDNPCTADMKRLIRTNLGRANQLGDGAPLVWLFDPKCWTGAALKKATFNGETMKYQNAATHEEGDVLVIPKSKNNLTASRTEFFRVLKTQNLFTPTKK